MTTHLDAVSARQEAAVLAAVVDAASVIRRGAVFRGTRGAASATMKHAASVTIEAVALGIGMEVVSLQAGIAEFALSDEL